MKSILWVAVATVAVLQAGGCRVADTDTPPPRPAGSGVYVVNEGGFGGGGNLGFLDPATGTITQDLVANADAWLFPTDIVILDGKIYVALSGNDRIDVVDPASDSVTGTIPFPRGMGPGHLAAEGGWLYCAHYDGSVSRIDPASDTIAALATGVVGFPGDILAAGGRIFVSDYGAWPDTGSRIVALDPLTLAVEGYVDAPGGPASMAAAGGMIFAGSGFRPLIRRIDPATLAAGDSCLLAAVPGDLAADDAHLYALTVDAVVRIPLASFAADSAPFIRRAAGLYHYALGHDPASGEFALSTVTGGGGAGQVSLHAGNGAAAVPPAPSGVFPGAFAWYGGPASFKLRANR